MDKKTMRVVLGVVLGLAVFTMLSAVVSMLFNAILSKDVIVVGAVEGDFEDTISYVKYSSIGLVCITVAAIVSFFFAYFGKQRKVFAPIAAGLSLLLIAMCLAFVFDLRGIVMKFESSSIRANSYAVATEYFAELISVMVAAIISCAYFGVTTALSFKKKNAVAQANQKADNAEVTSQETDSRKEVNADEKV